MSDLQTSGDSTGMVTDSPVARRIPHVPGFVDRLQSVRARIFVAIGAILGLVALVVMLYSQSAVHSTVVEAEQRAVENVLHMAELAIRSEYRTLLAGKVALVQERKRQFREFDRVALDTLYRFRELAVRGVIEESQAQTTALEWLASVRPVGGEYLMVFDRAGRALVYPERVEVGSLLHHYTDFKGRSVVDAAWDEVDRYGETYLVYHWKAVGSDDLVPRYGHFVAFDPWDWMLAAVGDVDEVQREADARLERFREELAHSLAQVEMAGGGFVFVFDGDGEFVVRPPAGAAVDAGVIDAQGLRDIRASAVREGEAVRFHTTDGRMLQAWATYVRSLDWYVAAVVAPQAMAAPAVELAWRQAAVFAGGLLLGLLLAWLVASGIAGPLAHLGRHARALSETDFSRRARVADSGLPLQRRDEVGELARAFAFMEDELHRNVHRLMAVTGERERIEGELGVARDIQLGLLPKVFPAFPERPDIDVYATLVSAREVGGDLYDFHLVGDELHFTIGDVAGKGVPAALFMAITKTLIKSASDEDGDPARVLYQVNENLARDNPNAMFVTAINGVLDCRSGRIRYANGGHNPPLVLRGDATVETLRAISGPALGAIDQVEFDAFETRLEPGDVLLLYTDGVTEAMDDEYALFGETRLLETLQACMPARDAATVIDAVMDAVRAHAGDAEQSDDITMLALHFCGPEAARVAGTGGTE